MDTRSHDDHHDTVLGARRVLCAPVEVDITTLVAVHDGLLDGPGVAMNPWRTPPAEHRGDLGGMASRRPA